MREAKVEKPRYEKGASRAAHVGTRVTEALPPNEAVLTAALLGIPVERAIEALRDLRHPREGK
jgi:hypothetical protein